MDAVEIACCAVERDPEVDSVGYGGLPDSSGNMSLDGCIMLAPSRCGSVCAVRRFMHPVSIARRVMEHTSHIMLAGESADAFAEAQGFEFAELLSPQARQAYETWLAERSVINQARDKFADQSAAIPLPLDANPGSGKLFASPPLHSAVPDESAWKHHDTIGVLAIDSQGVLAGACSTSGTPYKLPGRVGDSPIIGHGLYVDPRYGAAVATGTGELIMSVSGSFLAVEYLRRGASPLDAACITLRRIAEHHDLQPHHQVAFIVLTPNGKYAAAALRPGFKVSYRDTERNDVCEPQEVLLA